MLVDPAGTRKRPESTTAQPLQEDEPVARLEPPRSRPWAVGWLAPAPQPLPGEWAPGNRYGWLASVIVRSAEPSDGNTRAQLGFARNRAANRPWQVPPPIAGRHPAQRQFVRGSLSPSLYLLQYEAYRLAEPSRCDRSHREVSSRSPPCQPAQIATLAIFRPGRRAGWKYLPRHSRSLRIVTCVASTSRNCNSVFDRLSP